MIQHDFFLLDFALTPFEWHILMTNTVFTVIKTCHLLADVNTGWAA